ncbi:MAG: AbrB/MazE/SpoVT family DNA-binding domain-containing protein [Candidatus Aenigmarchaeota archaeon]|nr:AbrB/MazE/SpoVT family DNA-binding domain-containing protein [Candidatus Aenigmarchaeota archaeon]
MFIEKHVIVGERGQITIPKEIRDQENIRPNQLLKIVDISGEISIKKISKICGEDLILSALSKAHGKITMKDWEDIQKERADR